MSSIAVVIAGGGTGGHLYPGIAVARALVARVPDATVTFAGTAQGLESRIVPREGFELDVIRSAGLKGKSIMRRLRGAVLLPLGFVDAWRLLSRRKPNLVVGVGGYSSGPVVLTAALRGIPTLVLEQNAVPGLTNRTLARFVRAAAVTYDETLAFFHGKGFVSGNPVRAEFVEKAAAVRTAATRATRRVLVIGGSQGSHALNTAVTAAVPVLLERAGLEIVHQTGPRELEMVQAKYRGLETRVRPSAFLDAVADEMAAADLAICRAGATTLAELAAIGLPAVLVPLPTATDDHQRKNAEALVARGAAVMIEERELTGDRLARDVQALLDDASRLESMSRAMRTTARPEAAKIIVDKMLALTSK